MKWLVMLACWVVLGCGSIYAIVHGLVPHLVAPQLFPTVQAREVRTAPLEGTIVNAGTAVRSGAEQKPDVLTARK